MGGVDLSKADIAIGEAGLRLGVFKVCPEHSLVECQSAAYISEKGYFLTVRHIYELSGISIKQDYNDEKVLNPIPVRTIVSSIDAIDGHPVEPEVFNSELIKVTGEINTGDSDLALVRLRGGKTEALSRLNAISYPLKLKYESPLPGERIFLAGFPSPKYNSKDLSQAMESYKVDFQEAYSVAAPEIRIVYPNRELFLSKGIFRGNYTEGRVSSGLPIGDSELSEQDLSFYRAQSGNLGKAPTYGSPSVDSSGGMSGGPFLNKNGEIFGLLSSNHEGFHKIEGLVYRDRPNNFTIGPSAKLANQKFDLEKLGLLKGNLEERVREISSRKVAAHNYTRNKLKEFKKYLNDLVAVLKKTGKVRRVFKMPSPGMFSDFIRKPNAHGTLKKAYNGRTQCQANSNEEETKQLKYFFVYEVEVVIESSTVSWIRYKSNERLQRKLFNFFEYNEWSPRFQVHTAKILGDVVHKNPFNDVQYGIKLRGFAPYFFDRDASDFGYYYDGDGNLLTTMLNGLISVKSPHVLPDDGKSDGYWSIFRCKAF